MIIRLCCLFMLFVHNYGFCSWLCSDSNMFVFKLCNIICTRNQQYIDLLEPLKNTSFNDNYTAIITQDEIRQYESQISQWQTEYYNVQNELSTILFEYTNLKDILDEENQFEFKKLSDTLYICHSQLNESTRTTDNYYSDVLFLRCIIIVLLVTLFLL